MDDVRPSSAQLIVSTPNALEAMDLCEALSSYNLGRVTFLNSDSALLDTLSREPDSVRLVIADSTFASTSSAPVLSECVRVGIPLILVNGATDYSSDDIYRLQRPFSVDDIDAAVSAALAL